MFHYIWKWNQAADIYTLRLDSRSAISMHFSFTFDKFDEIEERYLCQLYCTIKVSHLWLTPIEDTDTRSAIMCATLFRGLEHVNCQWVTWFAHFARANSTYHVDVSILHMFHGWVSRSFGGNVIMSYFIIIALLRRVFHIFGNNILFCDTYSSPSTLHIF